MPKKITLRDPVSLADRAGKPLMFMRADGQAVVTAEECHCVRALLDAAGAPTDGSCVSCGGSRTAPAKLTHARFCEMLADDPKFGVSLAAIRASNALVRGAVEPKESAFVLTDAEHAIVVGVLNEPSPTHALAPPIARACLPFIDAIVDAPNA